MFHVELAIRASFAFFGLADLNKFAKPKLLFHIQPAVRAGFAFYGGGAEAFHVEQC